ncbi:MAG: PD-(D/E)XK nuclease family protein [Rikenellaceae bacterium]
MKGFLYEVAEDLYRRYSEDVGELKVLLPSRRARLFFTDALKNITTSPIWEPSWISIDDMMSRLSGIKVGDRVRLIAELYKIYVKYHPGETFDRFYFWGEILLADFDMVDKYLIDADMLFRNVADIKELETDLSYLTEQQLRIVAFWSSIGPEADLSEQKRRFLKVWQSLLPIYHDFRAQLATLKIAYAGMVYRSAADKIRAGELSLEGDEVYAIAGFNALSECEKILFKELKNSTTTHFYWDWDNYYGESQKQEAGLFISKNRHLFPAAAETSHDNFRCNKEIEVVASSSSALECKYVATILDQIRAQGGVIDKNTAIVLTDESLLLPLLYALPKDIGKVNVTMGYPLRQSLAYSFVERLLELQSHARRSKEGLVSFYHIDVMGMISHPYLKEQIDVKSIEKIVQTERLIRIPSSILQQNDLLKKIFTINRGWSEISKYLIEIMAHVAALPHHTDSEGEQRVEFLSYLADQITTLHNSVEQCEIELTRSIYVSLLRRHLQPLRIPYEGEPLEGLQVMGILETRTLDFENVIILSMNDDNFPGNRTSQPSYIPYNLRAAYELPTPEHHDGVHAYYFYRLIQRSKKLWMLYCSRADDKSTGEQSRYITQLEFESPFTIHRRNVGVDVNLFDREMIQVDKVSKVAEQLRLFCTESDTTQQIAKLSPTALFQYVVCPLRFYFRSLARIKIGEEISEEVDAPMFGNILHNAMQFLYEPLIGVANIEEAIKLIKPRNIEDAVARAIREQYLRGDESEIYSGNLLLVREVIVNYIKSGILKFDALHPTFEVQSVELPVEHFVELTDKKRIRLWGICDRIDTMNDGSIRVVDYKTGAPHLEFAGLEALFYGEAVERQSNIFQTLLYSYMLREKRGDRSSITPSLYYVRSMNDENYSPLIVDKSRKKAVESYEDLHSDFSQLLHATITELFDESTPFRQCADAKSCQYCDYRDICRRDEE